MLLTQVHKLSWALSQILPIITHMLSNLGSHKKYSSYYYQNWAAKLHFSHTKSNIIRFVGKTQRKPKIPKSHYDVANSKVPLRCGTIYKARCYTTILYKISKSFLQSLNSYLASIFTKPEFLFGIYFTKPEFLFGIYFRKAQILIWHYFIKPKILFWQLSLHSFIKPKY